jgi:hypothetical protein
MVASWADQMVSSTADWKADQMVASKVVQKADQKAG